MAECSSICGTYVPLINQIGFICVSGSVFFFRHLDLVFCFHFCSSYCYPRSFSFSTVELLNTYYSLHQGVRHNVCCWHGCLALWAHLKALLFYYELKFVTQHILLNVYSLCSPSIPENICRNTIRRYAVKGSINMRWVGCWSVWPWIFRFIQLYHKSKVSFTWEW